MPHRPERLVVCLGTATEIGKTWVGAATLTEIRAHGVTVAARKPAQSFDPDDAAPTDAQCLATATGEEPDLVCPPHRNYSIAMAPPMAADALGRTPIAMADYVDEISNSWPADVSVGWVESAGGVRSPIAHDGDGRTLVTALEPDLVVLVADAELGTLNAVRTALDALAPVAPRVVVYLNRYDPNIDLHVRNLDWLSTRDGDVVVTEVEALAEMVSRVRP